MTQPAPGPPAQSRLQVVWCPQCRGRHTVERAWAEEHTDPGLRKCWQCGQRDILVIKPVRGISKDGRVIYV